jgi:AraC family transcriptional regulator
MSVHLHFAADHYGPGLRHAPHEHTTLQLSIVLAGSLEERVGGVTERAGPLSVVCKAAGVRHADDFGRNGARLARLTLPRGELTTLLDDATRATEWRWTHDPRVAAPFLRVVHRAATASRAPVTLADEDPDLLDLLAAISARAVPPARGAPPAWLAETITWAGTAWRPAMRVPDIAARAGVHPVYLTRCVRRWYGVSVSQLLQQLRLRDAVARATRNSRPISEAAHEAGFADEAHFNRAMREATGMPPGRFRDLLRQLEFDAGA